MYQVGNLRIHHAFIGNCIGEIDRPSVHCKSTAAQKLHVQTGGRNDNVCFKLLARGEFDAIFGEVVYVVGDDFGFALFDGAEQIAVRYQTQSLIPWVVSGCEVFVYIIVGSQSLAYQSDQAFLHFLWFFAHALIHKVLQLRVFKARQRIRD